MIRLYIAPELGHRSLSRLAPQDLESLYGKLLAKGLSPRSVRLVHAVIHRALRQAERWSLVSRNVARLVDAPRPAAAEIRPFSPEEIRQLLTAAEGDRLGALYVLAVTSGLRQGELFGLRWADVDLDSELVRVRQQLHHTRDGWTFTEPKTRAGRRTVAIPRIAVAAMRQHRVRQNAERLRCGPAWEDLDLVFTNETGRPCERRNLVRQSFQPLLERAGLRRVRFHDLRHSAATLLLAEGVHPKVVQERLGHASISITMDTYSHVLPTMQAEAAAKLDSFFEAG